MIKSQDKAYDFKVQVRHQEREEDASVASLYRSIFLVTINDFVDVIFIPSFSRDKENWSLTIPDYVEHVRSLDEARQFTAALSEYTVTPDDSRAGQEALIALAPPLRVAPEQSEMKSEAKTGVIFYVTSQEFIRFTQELTLIEEYTWSVYEHLPFSEVKNFECIQFILNDIVTSPHFAEEHSKIVNLPWYDRLFAPHEIEFNKIEPLIPDEDEENSVISPAEFALQRA